VDTKIDFFYFAKYEINTKLKFISRDLERDPDLGHQIDNVLRRFVVFFPRNFAIFVYDVSRNFAK
jgi:hypothetical protein